MVDYENGSYKYQAYLTCKKYKTEKMLDVLKKNNTISQTGDGLYEMNNELVYRGENPNNYVLFNDELWRIVKIDKDNKIKIILTETVKRNLLKREGQPLLKPCQRKFILSGRYLIMVIATWGDGGFIDCIISGVFFSVNTFTAERTRRAAHPFTEAFAEIARAVEPGLHTDFCNRQIGFTQQLGGIGNAAAQDADDW